MSNFKTVTIAGTGLMGGSFALALRKAGFAGRMVGVASANSSAAAIQRGIIDEALPFAEAVAAADLLYMAWPIDKILAEIPRLQGLVKPSVLVTDAGSTKAAIVAQMGQHLNRTQFVGGHPMTGKAVRGVEVSDANIFPGQTYVLTPDLPEELVTPAKAELVEWIKKIGSRLVVMNAAEHDKTVAVTSHLTQLVSTALANVVARAAETGRHFEVSGPGLIDMTRLALSDHSVWGPILETNRGEVDSALAEMVAELEAVRQQLGDQALSERFTNAAAFRQRLVRAKELG